MKYISILLLTVCSLSLLAQQKNIRINGTGAAVGAVPLSDNYGTLNYSSQLQNRVLASPNGSSGVVSLRALVSADVPSLDAAKITTGTLPIARGGTGLTALGLALQQIRVNAGATALEYFTPTSSTELSGTIYGDGTMAAFPTGVSYLILNPTANNTIDLSTGATYIGAAGRVAMIFNPTNYTFQIHGVTISNHFVYVVWTATNSPGFINL